MRTGLSARTGGRYAFANWDEALDRLFTAATDRLIVIGEFPYLSKASPSLPSLIQRALESASTRSTRSFKIACRILYRPKMPRPV